MAKGKDGSKGPNSYGKVCNTASKPKSAARGKSMGAFKPVPKGDRGVNKTR